MKSHLFKITTWVVLVGLVFNYGTSFAQDEEEGPSKTKVKMAVSYKVDNDNKSSIKAKIKYKNEEKEIIYCENVDVIVYINEVDDANEIGKTKTNAKGIAIIQMNELFYSITDTLNAFDLVVLMPEDDLYLKKQSSLSLAKAKLEFEVYEEDSIRYVKAHLQKKTDTAFVPMADVTINFAIKCTFSNLSFGGDYTSTDEEGYVTVEFPNDVVEDEKGNIELVVSLLDDDDYGTIEKRQSVTWGQPLVIDNSELFHKLWSTEANAPVPLVAIILLLIIGIWGTLFYLIFDLRKIKKMGKVKQE